MKTETNVNHNGTQTTNHPRSLSVKTGIKAGPRIKGGGGEWISNHNETQVRVRVGQPVST